MDSDIQIPSLKLPRCSTCPRREAITFARERCIHSAQLIRRERPNIDAVADVAIECVRNATFRLHEPGRQEGHNHFNKRTNERRYTYVRVLLNTSGDTTAVLPHS